MESRKIVLDDTQDHRQPDESHPWRMKLVAGCLAVACVLTACSSDQEPVERHAPQSAQFYLDGDSDYYTRLAQAAPYVDEPVAATNLELLRTTAVAEWLNGPNDQTRAQVQETIAQSRPSRGIPMFVAYGMPGRDDRAATVGQAEASRQYADWIDGISQAVGDAPAIIILEPDALAGTDEQDGQDRTERIELLRQALQIFKQDNTSTAVYLDAGHSRWLSPDGVVSLLREVDPDGTLVGGISLNVSNQRPEAELRLYVEAIWARMDRKVYIMLDNAMNGTADAGKLSEWCNPEGETTGMLDDTYFTADELVEEAYVKPAGESDGACGTSTAPAGVFDLDLLLRQLRQVA